MEIYIERIKQAANALLVLSDGMSEEIESNAVNYVALKLKKDIEDLKIKYYNETNGA